MTASDRVVAELERRGGLAHADAIEAAVAKRIGAHAAAVAIRLALIGGRVESVTLLDGTPGLRLVQDGQETAR